MTFILVAAGRGQREHAPRAALCRGRHLEGLKYGILKYGRFWRIGVCITDSDIFTPLTSPNTPPVLGPHLLTVSAPRPHSKQCVHQETYTGNLTDLLPVVQVLS